MKPDILIPTNKPEGKLWRQISAIRKTAPGCRIIPSCFSASAATNRNWTLLHAGPLVVMVDDDIQGYFPGWAEKLCEPLKDTSVVMVSARLMKPDGKTPGVMMNIPPDLSQEIVTVADRMVPSACIAFRNDGTHYDEAYEGAGFEDTDHCMQLGAKYPNGVWIIHNGVKLIHKNEMKGQQDYRFQKNRTYYLRKWGIV
jgi:hypothetical protein